MVQTPYPTSYKVEVMVTNETTWSGNALRFKTHKEAQDYAYDLASRWTAVTDSRVVPCDDEPNR